MPRAYARNADMTAVSDDDLFVGLAEWMFEHARRRFPSEKDDAFEQMSLIWAEIGRRHGIVRREKLGKQAQELAKHLLANARGEATPQKGEASP